MFGRSDKKAMEDALERCLAMLEQGAKLEECLAAYPAQAAQLRSLLATARILSAAASPAPSPQAKAAGQARLQEAIHARLAAQPATPAPSEAEVQHVLNTCLERMRLGETMERCLTDYPSFAPHLRPLLTAASAMQAISSAQPRPEAKALGKERPQAAINAKLAQATAHAPVSDTEFATVLNTCIERISRGATVEVCLASYPHLAERLDPLLRTAAATQAAYRVKPRQTAKAAGRAKLRGSAARGSGGGVWRIPTALMPLRAWGASAAVLMLMFGGYGVVQAAEGAKPDSVLYPVKRTVEDLQQNAPFRSEESKAKLAAQFAERRTEEIAYLAEKGASGRIEDLTEDLNKQVTRFVQFQTKNAEREVTRLQAKIDAQLGPDEIAEPGITPVPSPAAEPSGTPPARPTSTALPATPERTRPVAPPPTAKPLALLTQNDQTRIEKQRQILEQSKARLTEQYQKYVEKLEEARKMTPPERLAHLNASLEQFKAKYDQEIARLDYQLANLSAIESNAAITRPQDAGQTPSATRPVETKQPQTPPATRPVETKPPVTRPATRPAETKPPTQVPLTRPATRPAETKPPVTLPPTKPVERTPELTVPATRPVSLTTQPQETKPPQTIPPTPRRRRSHPLHRRQHGLHRHSRRRVRLSVRRPRWPHSAPPPPTRLRWHARRSFVRLWRKRRL
jgi:uncharacterized protein (DUF433 family)